MSASIAHFLSPAAVAAKVPPLATEATRKPTGPLSPTSDAPLSAASSSATSSARPSSSRFASQPAGGGRTSLFSRPSASASAATSGDSPTSTSAAEREKEAQLKRLADERARQREELAQKERERKAQEEKREAELEALRKETAAPNRGLGMAPPELGDSVRPLASHVAEPRRTTAVPAAKPTSPSSSVSSSGSRPAPSPPRPTGTTLCLSSLFLVPHACNSLSLISYLYANISVSHSCHSFCRYYGLSSAVSPHMFVNSMFSQLPCRSLANLVHHLSPRHLGLPRLTDMHQLLHQSQRRKRRKLLWKVHHSTSVYFDTLFAHVYVASLLHRRTSECSVCQICLGSTSHAVP